MRDTLMNRRELLERAAWLLGGAISAPTVLAVLNGCSDKRVATVPLVFDRTQHAIIEEVAEIIIPRTATPGAKDVGVPSFIESILKDAYASDEQEHFVTGLTDFATQAQRLHGAPFLQLDPNVRTAFVYRVHGDAVAAERARRAKRQGWKAAEKKGTLPIAQLRSMKRELTKLLTGQERPARSPRSFILTMKELTLLGFFTSQAGATQVLQYEPVPGRMQACIPLKLAGNGKTWAVETSLRF